MQLCGNCFSHILLMGTQYSNTLQKERVVVVVIFVVVAGAAVGLAPGV